MIWDLEDDMELLQLSYFLELAKSEHMTLTAACLNISQPALSATIKKLENELGVPLFERQGRNIKLTKYGEVYKKYVQEAFYSLKCGELSLQYMRDAGDNTLRLGVLSPYVWSDLFDAFVKENPHIFINRYSMEGSQYIEALLSGKIDMYLGGINDINHRKLSYSTLYTDAMVLMVNKKHPLSRFSEVDLRTCENEDFINLDSDTNLQQFINTMYYTAGFNPHVVMEVDYTLRDTMVAQNYGVCITTLTAAKKSTSDDLSYLTITYPPLRRKLGLVWNSNAVFSQAVETFRQFALQYYQNRDVLSR